MNSPNMNCPVILTSGARSKESCNRPCRNGLPICTMHHNLDKKVKEKDNNGVTGVTCVTWESLSKPKQKQFRDTVDEYIEKGTWRQNILPLVSSYRLFDFPKDEIGCCLHAFRTCHTKQSIVYKNDIMYVSDPHKGRCIKVDGDAPELTSERWEEILGKLSSEMRSQFRDDLQSIHPQDIDALLYHYRISTSSFLWNDAAIQVIIGNSGLY